MAAKAAEKPVVEVETEDDKELQSELKLLVDRIMDKDEKLVGPALEMLKYIIRTSTTSMTSVPKPLKYMAIYYLSLKELHKNMHDGPNKKHLADVISILALGTAGGDVARKQHDCLNYCLAGTMTNIGDWGHEYIRQLENEIVQTWGNEKTNKTLMPLIMDIMTFNCHHHAEIQGCDLLMEIDQLHLLPQYITEETYDRMCLYLTSCTKYVDVLEASKIMSLVVEQYMKFEIYSRALIIALQSDNKDMVKNIFKACKDKATLYQLAFICGRHLYQIEIDPDDELSDELTAILGNNHLSSNFLTFARELDIMDPKTPEDVYKIWLEPATPYFSILGDNIDSARQNLASSFVNGFVNAGFGCDKLLTTDTSSKWIYRNKDHGMLSAAASLGMLHLWDVDGGLTPIDKYLYSTEDYIKSGALLALGIVNCRVKNECDPALALLSDYVNHENAVYQTGAVFGIGLAYVGTAREDVLDLLSPIVQGTQSVEVLGIASLSCGLIALGRSNHNVITTILFKIIEANNTEQLRSPFMRLAGLGVALCYMGCKESIEVPYAAMDVFEEPFKTMVQTMLKMCAYAGTGDVLIVQELLRIVEEKITCKDEKARDKVKKDPAHKKKDRKNNLDWDYCMGQAIAVLAVAAVSKGEEIGAEMVQRIFGHIGRYGEPIVRKAVPLAIALTSVSNPQLSVIDILTKYSHDSEDDVACNAIFGLGFVGAGTNNARLAACLRQLAVYHTKNPSQLFMVRLSQGLLHLGKGTMTLSPLHTDRQLVDPVAMAGLLIPLVALVDPHSLILGKAHYLLYTLVTAIQPRWLLTLGEDLQPLSVTVRVGQAVDIVGKAGTPKTIAGIHTHTTPVLLAAGERAELVNEDYVVYSPTLDGVCVLKKC
ncbi:26S proteasome non-ATPase regulatory subunit 2-like [Coccinella septempunctata]|uniref:26S proteasome non-ATPase regulatory subunit 2-like n=1 Tax=Coccinella septempunctata TaxID=41139 RepID=UPI001D097A00|nr:26S proteasome non-ATPase regulatory subunit 2-like [Coccinella septempunctata]